MNGGSWGGERSKGRSLGLLTLTLSLRSVVQDQGLQEVESLQRRPGSGACTRLKQALEELVAGSR